MDISILLFLQNFRNGWGKIFSDFFLKMTFFGELNTSLVIMAIIYWAVNKELGTYLLMGWSGNRLINSSLKITACAYRPWIKDARIIPYGSSIKTATGYSFPSGHTMNASSLFGGIMVHKKMPGLLRIISLIFVLLVAFSRLYLGVHTPQDVLAGAAFGTLMMFLTYILMNWLQNNSEKDWIVALTGTVLFIILAIYASVKPYPVDYDSEGKILVEGAKMANDTFKAVGWGIAFLTGWLLERRFVKFSTDIPLEQRLTRSVTGLLSYYAVSTIFVPLIKAGILGPAGTILSCFFQMFFIAFIFPLGIKLFERPTLTDNNTGADSTTSAEQ